jgi:hypothetical protein
MSTTADPHVSDVASAFEQDTAARIANDLPRYRAAGTAIAAAAPLRALHAFENRPPVSTEADQALKDLHEELQVVGLKPKMLDLITDVYANLHNENVEEAFLTGYYAGLAAARELLKGGAE